VGELSALGVACFKIEGRLKSAHYVAATTQTYRNAIESFRAGEQFRITPQQRGDLEQTFSRGFTHGFLSGVNHQELVAARFPKSRGTRIGRVAEVTHHSVMLQVERSNTVLKPGDGIVFDEGHPEQDEQGGRVFSVTGCGKNRLEIELRRGEVNLSAISVGAIVWKTDDPAIRRRLEHSFSRDTVARRVPLNVNVRAHVGEQLSLTFSDDGGSITVTWDRLLEPAQKFPLGEQLLRDQIGRLGSTPYELDNLTLDIAGSPMVPKSVLNDLRRQAVEQLLADRAQRKPHALANPDALQTLRARAHSPATEEDGVRLHVLVRSLDQLESLLEWKSDQLGFVYCDFEDIRRYREAVSRCRAANIPVALATLRIVKPGEDGVLRQILDCSPDAVLVRNLAGVAFYREHAPHLPQFGDYSLNIANELTAQLFADAGLARVVPSYDLNWKQLAAMLSRSVPQQFECVVHQHMPMFHMEHCVFAHTLSNGKDFHDCGRPCERHQVDLRDRVGEPHPLIPDVGCRNTLFNAQAQTAAEYIPEMLRLGIRHFRVELLREKRDEVVPLLNRYADLIAGRSDPRSTMRSLRVLNQLGVTRGTLDRE
jgi:putative protease